MNFKKILQLILPKKRKPEPKVKDLVKKRLDELKNKI